VAEIISQRPGYDRIRNVFDESGVVRAVQRHDLKAEDLETLFFTIHGGHRSHTAASLTIRNPKKVIENHQKQVASLNHRIDALEGQGRIEKGDLDGLRQQPPTLALEALTQFVEKGLTAEVLQHVFREGYRGDLGELVRGLKNGDWKKYAPSSRPE
jgi:hypothetical protein